MTTGDWLTIGAFLFGNLMAVVVAFFNLRQRVAVLASQRENLAERLSRIEEKIDRVDEKLVKALGRM